jgi:periplasmic protein TonB
MHILLSCTLSASLALAQTSQSAAPPSTQPAPDSQTPAPAASQARGSVRIASGIMMKNSVHTVAPVYPDTARINHVTGVVTLEATVGTDGTVINLKVVSGPPLLRMAAIDAVKQWQYRPTILNGTPVQVVTQINLNFTLDKH